jgi:hypothetical protein
MEARRSERRVARRRVFYIPGYDPFHPRRYRELYRKEGARQAAISGYELALAPRRGGGPYGWRVTGQIDGAETVADVEVLVWSDLVRDSMSNSIPATYAQLLRTAWIYIASGALGRLMRLRKGPVIAALYPVGMLLLQLLLALAAGSVAGAGAAALAVAAAAPVAGPAGAWAAAAAPVLRWPVAALVAVLVLRWFRRQDGRFYAYYLMHDYAHSCSRAGAYPPELEERLARFADRVATALAEGPDEVLVVGHSSGAHLGVSVLADLIRSGRVPPGGPALGFLSLGQVVPMISFLPRADRLRADLAFLSQREELTWVDVTAPGDGCAFALCDPVAVSGVGPPGKRWPLVISAAFTRTLSPARWKALRWRFFRLHFQYLCAFDRPGDYDYFRITAGPRTLADRYRGRAPSRSRIDAPASKYTSVAA